MVYNAALNGAAAASFLHDAPSVNRLHLYALALLPLVAGLLLHPGAVSAQAPEVSIAPASQTVSEGNDAVFIVTVHGTTTMPTTATYSITGVGVSGSASPQDIGAPGTTTPLDMFLPALRVRVEAGVNSTATITIPVLRDGRNEADELFAVRLTGAEGAATALSGDFFAVVEISASADFILSLQGPAGAVEGDTAEYDFLISGDAPVSALQVPYRVAVGGAAAPADLQILTPGAAPFGGVPAAATGYLAIAAGTTAGTLLIRIADDAVTETAAESIEVSVGDDPFRGNDGIFPLIAAERSVRTTLTDPSAGRVLLSAGPAAPLAEGATATFTVRVVGAAANATTATYIVSGFGPDPASAADFAGGEFPSGAVVIPAGANPSAAIELPILDDDSLPEGRETFQVLLTGVESAGAVAPAANSLLVAAIAADGVIIAGPAAAIAEGGEAVFTVTARGQTTQDTVVTWSVLPGAASPASPDDFGNADNSAPLAAFPTGTMTIAAGVNAAAEIRLPVFNDAGNEDAETFSVSLTGAAGGMTATGPPPRDAATATIAASNDDFTFTFSGPAAVVEGDVADYTLQLQGGDPLTQDLVAAWTIDSASSPTTVDGNDYRVLAPAGFGGHGASNRNLTIPAGGDRAIVRIRFIADFIAEAATETLAVFVETAFQGNNGVFPLPASGADAENPNRVGLDVVISDPPARRVILDAGPETPVAEGASATFIVRIPGASSATTVQYTVTGSGDNPATAADFAGGALPSGSVVVSAGMDSSATIAIPLAADFTTEERETFTLTLTGASAESTEQPTLSANPSRQAAIAADAVGVVSLSGPETPVLAEDSTPTFVVRLSGAINGDAQVRYRVTSTAAGMQPADFGRGRADAFPEGVLTLAAGTDTGVNLEIPVYDDNRNEADEAFEVFLELVTVSVGGVTLRLASTAGAAVVITDNDPVVATLIAPSQPVGEGANAVFAVELSGGARDAGLTMAWSVTTQTGVMNTAAPADFGDRAAAAQFPAGTLTFAPGDRRMTAEVAVFEDFVMEGEETFVFELERAVGAAGEVSAAMTATASIAASGARDRVFAVAGPYSVAEGDTATWTVAFESGADIAAGGLTLNWAIEARGAAAAGADDFTTARTGSVAFAAGDAAGTTRGIVVAAADDALAEGRETFALVLDDTAGGVRQAPVASILDDDEITIALSGGGATAEGLNVSFTVTLGGSTRQNTAAIPWRIAADTDAATADAAAAADYEPDSGFFIMEPGATTATVSVTVVDDEVTERAEVFVMHLDEATSGAEVSRLLSSTQTSTIAQSDPRRVVFERAGYLASETSGTVSTQLRFEPPGAAGEDVTVRLAPFSLGVPEQMGADAGTGDYRFFNAAGDTALPAGTANTRVTLPAGETGAPAKIQIQDLARFETTRTLGLVIGDALIGGTSASGLVAVGESSTTAITIQDNDRIVVSFLRERHDFIEDTRSTPAAFIQWSNIGSRLRGQPTPSIVIERRRSTAELSLFHPSLPFDRADQFGMIGDVSTRSTAFNPERKDFITAHNFRMFDDNLGLENEEVSVMRFLPPDDPEQDQRIAYGQFPETEVASLDNEFLRASFNPAFAGMVTTASEGSTVNMPWVISALSIREIEARYSITTTGEVTEADFDLTTPTSVLPVRMRNTHFALPVVDDDIAENDERVEVEFILITRFSSGLARDMAGDVHRATLLVTDNDDVRVGFEQANYTVSEDGGTLEVCAVSPAYTRSQTVTVRISAADGSARRGADYTFSDADLTAFTGANEVQRRCVDVTILEDDIVESDEVLTLSLATAAARTELTPAVATVTIEDNEEGLGFDNISGLYADRPQNTACPDCPDDGRIVFQLANPAVSGATFSFDAQARLTPPDGPVRSAFLSQVTFGIVHDDAVLNNCRAARAGLTMTRDNGLYLQTAMAAATGTTAWTFTATGAGAYDAGDAAANRTRFGELTTDYRDLLRVECDIADTATRTDVGISAVGWNQLRTFAAANADHPRLAYAGNRFDDIATDGGAWAPAVNLYGDGRRANVVMNELLQGPVSSATFTHTGGGVSITAAALAQASSRVIELTLSGDSAGGAVTVAAGQSLTTGGGATIAAGYHLARLPAHDNAAPEMTAASFDNNNTVRLAFSPAFSAAAVSTADFVLSVPNPGAITGAEVVALATDSNTTVTLVLRTLGGGPVQDGAVRSPDGAETLQIRLARNFAGDITDNNEDGEDHRAETHQAPSEVLAFGDDLRPELLELTAVNRTSASGAYSMNFRARFSEEVDLQNGVRVLEVRLAGDNTGGAVVTNVSVVTTRQGADATSATYAITLGPLTPAQYPGAGNGYAVELVAAAITDDAGNALFPAADRRATMGGHNRRGVFHALEDFDPPQLTGAVLDDANANLTLTFDEPVLYDAATGSAARIEITANPGGWITAAAVTSLPASAAQGSTEVRLAIATQGPAPLNGASAEGRETARITLLAYTGDAGVRWQDAAGNLLASGATADFGFNDNAVPAIAAVGVESTRLAGDTTRRATWTVRFTEPVTGVVAGSFDIYTLPSSTASVAAGESLGGAGTFAGADFAFTAGATTATYTVELAEPLGETLYYLPATTDANVISEAPPKTRALGGVVQTGPDGARGVLTLRDEIPPELLGAALDAANENLTLTFSEPVQFDAATGSVADIEITDSPGGWITTAALTSFPTIPAGGSTEVRFAIETQGPAPLNGASPEGRETARITLLTYTGDAGVRWQDAIGNLLASGASADFGFNDNAAPAIAAVGVESVRLAGDTTRRAVWTVRFTEPVTGVVAGSFDIYTLPSSTASVAAGESLGGAGTFAGADFAFTAGATTATYTVELAEPLGETLYYLPATTDANVISEAPPKTRALGGVVQTGPDGARGLLTLRDERPPQLLGLPLITTDNTTVIYRFDEDVQRAAATTEALIALFNAGIATASAASLAGDPAGYDRTAVVDDAVSGIRVTGAALAARELRLVLAISGPAPLNGAVPVTATNYLQITFPTGAVADIIGGGLDGNSVVTRTDAFTLADTAAPRVVSAAPRGAAVENPDTTYRAAWTVVFTEPVSGVGGADFALCAVDAAGDACTGETAFHGTVMNAAAAVSREYIVSTSSLVQRIGAPVFYRLQVDESAAIDARDAPGQGIEGLPFTGGAHEAPDTVAPVLTDASMDFPAGNRATATLVFNETVTAAAMSDFASRARIELTASSEWLERAALAGAAVADGARLHIPLQTSGAAPVNGGSPDGVEAVTITLAAGAVSDVVASANSAEYRRRLAFPENAPPQLRLLSGALPDFRRGAEVLPDTGGTRRMTWHLRFTEAVAGVTSASFTLLSAPALDDDSDLAALADSLTSAAGAAALATSATTFSSFTAAPVTGASAVVVTSGSAVYSDTWRLTAAGLPSRNITTTTRAHYIVRLDQTAAASRIADDENRFFAAYAPARPIWSEAQSVGDIEPPLVTSEGRVTAVPGRPYELLVEVAVADALTATSAATFTNNFGVRSRNGAAVPPAGPFATVSGMELVRYDASADVLVAVGEDETTLTFRVNLTGTLDNGESAVGGERFRFTIPGGRLTDLFENTQEDDMTFTVTAPESGAPEVTEFSLLSSVEREPNSGVFDLRYLLAFTEPVAIADGAPVLYSSPGRNQPPLTRRGATLIRSVLSGALATGIAPSSIISSGSQARVVVAYDGVQRPARRVRGYAAFLRDTGATESGAPMTKTLEDCPYYETDRAMTGCLSASADVSDVEPPRLRGAGYAGSRLWLQFDEPVRALSGGVELADGDALEGFEVLPGHQLGQMTSSSVVVERALYRAPTQSGVARGIELELDTLIQGTETTVWVRYTPPAAGAGIYDNADLRGLNTAANRIAQVRELQIAEGLTADSDGDGIPDAAEIEYGGSPLAPLSDAELAALPQVVLGRGVSDIAHIAYSGIRAAGADAHLGVGTTGTVAARRAAYYLSDTFGYTPAPGAPGYACGGRFPANYRAPVARGGCAVVDFADIRAGVEHRIGWLAAGASGYWLPQGTTSTLYEQRIVRVPELNMSAERLFFLNADAESATVAVEAAHDGPAAAADLTLAFTTGQPQTGRKTFSFAVAKSAVGGVSRTWGIAGLSGGGASLWLAGTGTGVPTANSYSLGLTTQTTVVRLGDDSLPPTVGSPVLFRGAGRGAGDVRSVLSAGVFAVRLPVENPHPSLAPAVSATGAGAAALSALSAVRSGARIEVALTVAAVTTPVPVTLRISAPGRGATATVTASWPIVPSGHALADMAANDGDGDGIADDNDLYEDNPGLPVAVLDADESLAGADSWHHIRPVLAGQSVRVGAATLRRAADRENLMSGAAPAYATYAASFFDVEGFEVVYDFSVYDVDYSSQMAQNSTAATIAGGRAGVIIPLPQSLYDDAGLALFKYRESGAFGPFAASPGGNDYGFAPLTDGACPDDTGVAGSPYRDGGGGLRRPKSGGDACLVVYVADGGEYDEDEASPNGVVHDPLGLRAGGGRSSGGGGSFGAAGLLLLMLYALFASLRRRSARAARGGGERA